MRRVEDTGITIYRAPPIQSKSKIAPDGFLALAGYVDEHPDITLQDLCTKLAQEHGITVCKATILKALTNMGFTVKLTRPIPISKNCPDTVLARRQYAQMFLSEESPERRDIVLVDKYGFNRHLRRKFGRARRGEHAGLIVANSRGKNISACAAMSEDGFMKLYAQEHTMRNTLVFFLQVYLKF
jgi:hypothetical protein